MHSPLDSVLTSLGFRPRIASMVWCLGGCGGPGVDVGFSDRPNAVTAARCCCNNISKSERRPSSELSVSIVCSANTNKLVTTMRSWSQLVIERLLRGHQVVVGRRAASIEPITAHLGRGSPRHHGESTGCYRGVGATMCVLECNNGSNNQPTERSLCLLKAHIQLMSVSIRNEKMKWENGLCTKWEGARHKPHPY